MPFALRLHTPRSTLKLLTTAVKEKKKEKTFHFSLKQRKGKNSKLIKKTNNNNNNLTKLADKVNNLIKTADKLGLEIQKRLKTFCTINRPSVFKSHI